MTPSAEIYIQATDTDPVVQAQITMRQIHQRLLSPYDRHPGPSPKPP